MNEHPEAHPSSNPLPDAIGEPHPPVIEHAPITEPPVRRRGGTPLLLTLLLALVTGGGLYWVWANPKPVESQPLAATNQPVGDDAVTAKLGTQVQAMGQQIQTLSGRIDALEKRPAAPLAATPDGAAPGPAPGTAELTKRLDDLSAHVDALAAKQDSLAQRPAESGATAAQAPPPDTAAIGAIVAQQSAALAQKLDAVDGRLSKLEQTAPVADQPKAVPDQKPALDALDQRLTKLEEAAPPPDPAQALTQQKASLDGLAQRLAKVEQASQGAQQDQTAQQTQAALTALTGRVETLEQGAGDVKGVAKDASRAIRLEAAQTALAAGQPLGDLPGAPPALARFAANAPPTESSLRSAWPQVEAAARAASQPDLSHRSFLDRALARLQQSVTVRQGDQVIVGDPASGVLTHARQDLDNGDLKGAADTLAALNGPAAAAAHDWVAQVRALLEARAALVAMARS